MPDAPLPLFIGIDPGVSGGIVTLYAGRILCYIPLEKANRYDIRDHIELRVNHAKETGCKVFACIERVRGFIGGTDDTGHKINHASAHTMFPLGESYGALDMCLVCCRITRREVLPQEWQKRYGMKREKGETPQKWKSRLKAKAQLLYPDTVMTLAISDATLIAHHCSRLSWGV